MLAATLFALCLLLQDHVPLATIPEGLEIVTQDVRTSNRFSFEPRSSVVWTTDGTRVAYAAWRGNEWLPVVGGRDGELIGEPYDHVSVPVAAGGHVAFQVTRRTSESTEQSWLWVDGRSFGPEDRMGGIRISANGTSIAYWTEPGARFGTRVGTPSSIQDRTNYLTIARVGKDGKWRTERGDKWSDTGDEPPLLSAKGSRAAAVARGRAGWVVIHRRGKREQESDARSEIEEVALSADGSAVAYIGDGKLFFKDRRIAKKQTGLSTLAVDARGKHVGYAVDAGPRKSVGVDGDLGFAGSYDHVRALAFDPKGKHLAFVANVGGLPDERTAGNIVGGEWFVVVRPVSGDGAWEEGRRFDRIRDLVWDAKSERLAYCARDDSGWRMVCGDAASEPFDHVGRAHFQGKGEAIGFGARSDRELWWRTLVLE